MTAAGGSAGDNPNTTRTSPRQQGQPTAERTPRASQSSPAPSALPTSSLRHLCIPKEAPSGETETWLIAMSSPLQPHSCPTPQHMPPEGIRDTQGPGDGGRRAQFWLGAEVCAVLRLNDHLHCSFPANRTNNTAGAENLFLCQLLREPRPFSFSPSALIWGRFQIPQQR